MTTKGAASILVLILSTAFSITIGGLVLFVAIQQQITQRNESFQKALAMSESGINYYRWHLAHNKTDYADGTGTTGQEYTHQINDPQGGMVGQFTLTIDPPTSGSSFVKVTSTGSTAQHPTIKRTITAQFGEKSLAAFAFLHDANVWFGQGIAVYGEVFSNGGIRMDGTNTAAVRSYKEVYTCGVETGCYPNPEEKPGIWGNGGPTNLWEFPANWVDFNAISLNFTSMKDEATTSGVYLPYSNAQGYHLVFNSDGTINAYKVLTTDYKKGYSTEGGCEKLYQEIKTEESVGTYTIAQKPIIFAEDTVWVEGIVNGKITVVAVRLPVNLYSQNIWIKNSITYLAKDGNHALGLIAQKDIIFALDIPQTFEVDGALLAHKGKVIRHHYRKTNQPACSVYQGATRNELIMYGSIISSQKSYWNFSSPGGGAPASGFVKRNVTYDAGLLYRPPPYFPTTGEFDMVSWIEGDNP